MKLINATAIALVLGATSFAANAATTPAFIGQLMPTASADRTIVIDSNTRSVNVTQGEKVKFIVNGKEFAVDFDGAAEPVDLQALAPAGVLDHSVNAYVADSPFNLPN